jgi:putative inorganic carbon (HCO3(-)) transporter
VTFQQTRFQASASAQPIGRRPGFDTRRGVAPLASAAVAKGKNIGAFFSSPFSGIEGSISFWAFMAYIFATTTYKVPIGTVSMGLALLALPLEQKPIRFPAVAGLTLALVCWSLVGMATTGYPETVVNNTTEFAKVAAVVFVGINVLTTRNRIRAYVTAYAIEWALFPIRGAMVGHFAGADTEGRTSWNYIYSNPNDLAGLAILALAITLGMLEVEKRKWVMLGGMLTAGALVLTILLTASRGAMIALIAFGLVGARRYGKHLKNIKVVIAVVIIGGAVLAMAPESAWRRFSTIALATDTGEESLDPEYVDLATRQDQGSSVQRLAIWSVAVAIIADNPITGVGLGAYPEVHYLTWRRGGFNPIAWGRRDTHSTYLNLMAEIGIPGFLIFMTLCGYVLVQSRRAQKEYAARFPARAMQLFSMEVGLYGYLVAAIWGTYGQYIPGYVFMTVMAAMIAQLREEAAAAPVAPNRGAVVQPSARMRSQLASTRS